MSTSSASKLQSQLKRALRSLDEELSQISLDPHLERARHEMYVRRDDELGRLLAEVGQKAGLLDSARMRAGWMARQQRLVGVMTSASRIEVGYSEKELYDNLDADLPKPMTHGGITTGVDALTTSSSRYRLRIHVDFDTSFTVGMSGVEGISALPLLAGVRISDQAGVAYPVSSGGEANTSGDPVRRLTGSLEFTSDPGAPPTAITLSIASVLFAERQAFLATAASARLVDGPWEFTISVRQPS